MDMYLCYISLQCVQFIVIYILFKIILVSRNVTLFWVVRNIKRNLQLKLSNLMNVNIVSLHRWAPCPISLMSDIGLSRYWNLRYLTEEGGVLHYIGNQNKIFTAIILYIRYLNRFLSMSMSIFMFM
jgi:hypothetical protein